jgi:hypothetical protein
MSRILIKMKDGSYLGRVFDDLQEAIHAAREQYLLPRIEGFVKGTSEELEELLNTNGRNHEI